MADTSSDDAYLAHPRKRVRQACENCRRKKSRCPGEIPACSLCVRLRQRCVYSSRDQGSRAPTEQTGSAVNRADPANEGFEDQVSPWQSAQRLSVIETTLQRLTALVESSAAAETSPGTDAPAQRSSRFFQSSSPQHQAERPSDDTARGPSSVQASGSTVSLLTLAHQELHSTLQIPNDVIAEGVELYCQRFSNQPCPLFSHVSVPQWLASRDIPDIVLCPMLAVGLRMCKHAWLGTNSQRFQLLAQLSQSAWDLLNRAYSSFEFDEAFYEGLCVLAQSDFAVGKTTRAQAQVALGLRLALTQGLLPESAHERPESERLHRRLKIVWTLLILDRMFSGCRILTPTVSPTAFGLSFTRSYFSQRDHFSVQKNLYTLTNFFDAEHEKYSADIGSVNIELMHIWELVVEDIAKASSEEAQPFWRGDSRRGHIVSRLLELETKAAHHSYTATGSPTRVLHEPHLKTYFLARLFYHFLHCAIHCCLNHPFIIFMKTSQLRGRVPLTFLQESYEYSRVYADWIYRLVCEMEEAGLMLYDPFVGYLISIAASIHLERSLNENHAIANSSKRKFMKCQEFVREQSEQWPNMFNMLRILNRLQARLQCRQTMHYVQDDYDGAQPSSGVRNVNLADSDIQLMWDLFDYVSISNGTSVTSTVDHSDISTRVDGTYNPDVYQSPALDMTQSASRGVTEDMDMTTFQSGPAGTFMSDWSLFGAPWLSYYPTMVQPDAP